MFHTTKNQMVMIKYFSILVLLCYWSLGAYAQNSAVDSLETLLSQHPAKDTTRVNLLNEAAYNYRSVDIEKLLNYTNEANELSDKLKFKKGKSESLRLMGIYYLLKSDNKLASDYFQQAITLAESIDNQQQIAKILNNIGVLYLRQSDFATAIENFDKALKIYEKIDDKIGIASACNNIGIIYYQQGNYIKTLEYYQKSLDIAEALGDKSQIATTCNNIGSIYETQGFYPKALEYFHKSLKMREEQSDKAGVSGTFNNIGNIFTKQGDFAKALEYYNKALIIKQELGDKVEIALSYNNIGTAYNFLQNHAKALEFYNKSLQIKEEIGDKQGITVSYYNIGKIYLAQNNYSEALTYFEKSLNLATEINSQSYIAFNNIELSNTYFYLKNYKKAILLGEKGYKMATVVGERELIKNAAEILSKTYSQMGDFKKAYYYHVEYKNLSDSIANKENTKKIVGMEYTYKFEKEKQAIELEQQRKEVIRKAEKRQQRIVLLSFVVGFGLMLALAILAFRSYLHKRNTNRILSKQKAEIIAQAEELKTTNDKLIELSDFKEGMTGMIVHDLKNPLNSILGSENIDRIKQAGKQMLTMVMNILDVQKFEDAKMKLNFENYSAYAIAQNAYSQVEMLLKEKNISFENKILAQIGVQTETEILERVFVNLMSNATKYTPNNGKISVGSEKCIVNSENFVKIFVSDTGQGIPADKIHLVFERFGQIEAKKSGGIRSTGLGLTFCKLAVEAHGGEIGVESQLGEGTTFWFTIPLGKELEQKRWSKPLTTPKEHPHINCQKKSSKRYCL